MIKKVISEYGGAVGVLVVLAAIIALVVIIVGNSETSVVGQAMSGLVRDMQTSLTP